MTWQHLIARLENYYWLLLREHVCGCDLSAAVKLYDGDASQLVREKNHMHH
jgi:hypothetical protein